MVSLKWVQNHLLNLKNKNWNVQTLFKYWKYGTRCKLERNIGIFKNSFILNIELKKEEMTQMGEKTDAVLEHNWLLSTDVNHVLAANGLKAPTSENIRMN